MGNMALSSTNFDNLPDEVIEIIFSKLSLEDRKATKLVCWRFRKINAQQSLVWDDVTNVHSYTKINEYISPYVVHTNMKIELSGYCYSNQHTQFWKAHGETIKSVNIGYFLNQDLKPLVDILQLCPNLTDLTVKTWAARRHMNCKCADIFDFDMSRIETLDLAHISCPKLFKFLLQNTVKVKSLSLIGFVLKDVVSFLLRHRSVLKTLDLLSCFEENELLEILDACSGGVVVELTIGAGDLWGFGRKASVTPSDLLKIQQSLPNLERLALNIPKMNELELQETAIENLLKNLVKLKSVNLASASITDNNAAVLGTLPNLEALLLVNNEHITAKGLEKMFGGEMYPKIKALYLQEIPHLTDDCLAKILIKLPNIEELMLFENNAIGLKGRFLNNITRKLKYLDINSCANITLSTCRPHFDRLEHYYYYGANETGSDNIELKK